MKPEIQREPEKVRNEPKRCTFLTPPYLKARLFLENQFPRETKQLKLSSNITSVSWQLMYKKSTHRFIN